MNNLAFGNCDKPSESSSVVPDPVDPPVILLTWRFFKIVDHASSILQSIHFFKISRSNNLNSKSDHL